MGFELEDCNEYIQASVVADSVNQEGLRLTTLEVTFHRYILAEFNTHRAFSRNSASSRAIPIEKMIGNLLGNPCFPLEFGTNQPGMQAGPPLTGQTLKDAMLLWTGARDAAIRYAKSLQALGVHKQVTNRLLEPFMWHTAIVTSTEWENFFRQRCSELAQPEIHAVADKMRYVYDIHEPQDLYAEEWHLPYIQPDERDLDLNTLIKVSAARCARVSYLTQNGIRDLEKDIELFERLVTADPPHWSPLEHLATPMLPGLSNLGNFDGWAQLRHNLTILGD